MGAAAAGVGWRTGVGARTEGAESTAISSRSRPLPVEYVAEYALDAWDSEAPPVLDRRALASAAHAFVRPKIRIDSAEQTFAAESRHSPSGTACGNAASARKGASPFAAMVTDRKR